MSKTVIFGCHTHIIISYPARFVNIKDTFSTEKKKREIFHFIKY